MSTSHTLTNKPLHDANANEGNTFVAKALTHNQQTIDSESGRITDKKRTNRPNNTNRESSNIVTEQIVWFTSNPSGNYSNGSSKLGLCHLKPFFRVWLFLDIRAFRKPITFIQSTHNYKYRQSLTFTQSQYNTNVVGDKSKL